MAVVSIVRGMSSASRVVMKELRVLERLLRVLNVKVETRWLPSVSKDHADRLYKQWDPGDIPVTRIFLRSLQDSFAKGIGGVLFPYRPLGLPQ